MGCGGAGALLARREQRHRAAGRFGGEWRNAFLRMPYWRDETTSLGAILDTFESAVTWSGFDAFYDSVRTDVADANRARDGRESQPVLPLHACLSRRPAPFSPSWRRATATETSAMRWRTGATSKPPATMPS